MQRMLNSLMVVSMSVITNTHTYSHASWNCTWLLYGHFDYCAFIAILLFKYSCSIDNNKILKKKKIGNFITVILITFKSIH